MKKFRLDTFAFDMFMRENKHKIILGGVVSVIVIVAIFGAFMFSHSDKEFMSITGAVQANNTSLPQVISKVIERNFCDLKEFANDKNITGINFPICQLSKCDCECYIEGRRPEDKGQACDMACQDFTTGKSCRLVGGNCELI